MSDSSVNKPFQADDRRPDPEINLTGSLDLSGRPAGSYYYNYENNYNYTKNWFNYNRFDSVNDETIISEVVQYAKPELTPGTLDTSKTYTLPSTTLTASWAARVETGSATASDAFPGLSGTDAIGNTYVLVNFNATTNANAYNENGTGPTTKVAFGVYNACLVKYNSSGVVAWMSQIRASNALRAVRSFACTTDNQGTTYILVSRIEPNTDIVFENASGAAIFTLSFTEPNLFFLAAYSAAGTPDWVTPISATDTLNTGVSFPLPYTLTVDNQDPGNVYLSGQLPPANITRFGPVVFYDYNIASATLEPRLAVGTTVAIGADVTALYRVNNIATIFINDANRVYETVKVGDVVFFDGCAGAYSGFNMTFGTSVLSLNSVPDTTTVALSYANTGSNFAGTYLISQVSRNFNIATVVTSFPHGLATGQVVTVDCSDNTYDGALKQITVTGATTFTYFNPGANAANAAATGSVFVPVNTSTGSSYATTYTIVQAGRTLGTIATLQTSTAHTLEIGQTVTVDCSDNSFDGTFQVIDVPTPFTFTYFNPGANVALGVATGTVFAAVNALSGTPLLTARNPTASIVIAKFRASSGLFQWATYLDGFQVQYSAYSSLITNNAVFGNPCMTTDPTGNLFITGSYVQLNSLLNAATPTEPLLSDSGVQLPPYSSPVVWVPVEENRNWSAIDLNASGSVIVAAVNNGYIYVSTNTGTTWVQRASSQSWSAVYCNDTGLIMMAAVLGSVLYRSIDGGSNWTVADGEGANARNWVALAGNATGDKLVAVEQNGTIYWSTNFGLFWNTASAVPLAGVGANWVDAAYDFTTDTFCAAVQGGDLYTALGTNLNAWTQEVGTTKDWNAIAGTRGSRGSAGVPFYGSDNVHIYSFVPAGTLTIVFETGAFTPDLAVNSSSVGSPYGLLYAAEYNGPMYQSTFANIDTWVPTTIPRFWTRVALNYAGGTPGAVAAAVVPGGQVYVTRDSYPYNHTFLLKYNPAGQVQWANYVNIENPEGTNFGVALASQSTGNIILAGNYSGRADFFSASDLTTVVKRNRTFPADTFFASYSNDGIPLWTAGMQTGGLLSSEIALAVDAQDNIYCLGTPSANNPMQLYQPYNGTTAQIVLAVPTQTATPSSFLLQLYPNGYVQSFTLLTNSVARNQTASIRVVLGAIYISGLDNTLAADVLNFRNSPGTAPSGITESFSTRGAFVAKYTFSSTASWSIPDPVYNTTFQTLLSVGGSTRQLVGGYPADGAIELWGGKTGLSPSAINIADANAAVISYLGHEPGYSIPIVDGLQEFSPSVYRFLTVGLSEPTFPTNDPQPVTPGSVPYGYLPCFVSFPNYATGLVFNNTLNNGSELILSATGTISASGLGVTGISAEDVVRILISNATTSYYVTLTVKGFVLSDVIYGIQTGIVFEENTRFLANRFGTTANATAQLLAIGSSRYAPMFVLPALISEGTLKLALELYPKT